MNMTKILAVLMLTLVSIVLLAGVAAAETIVTEPGVQCRVIADNNWSVHDGTTLHVSSAGVTVSNSDVESVPHTITRATVISDGELDVQVVPGPSGLTSLEYDVRCRELPDRTVEPDVPVVELPDSPPAVIREPDVPVLALTGSNSVWMAMVGAAMIAVGITLTTRSR